MPRLQIELEDGTLAELKKAGEQEGKSAESLAAEWLVERLENAELNRIRREVRQLRHDLSLATQAILVTSNNVSEDEARKWVKENLRNS